MTTVYDSPPTILSEGSLRTQKRKKLHRRMGCLAKTGYSKKCRLKSDCVHPAAAVLRRSMSTATGRREDAKLYGGKKNRDHARTHSARVVVQS